MSLSAANGGASLADLKITIIVVNYNYGRFLAEAIESALAQTWENIEIVVVDDGSMDNSREIIGHYRGRVRAVSKPNGGQTSAFNAGFAASTGEIVIFLDADDRLHADCAATVAAVWKPAAAKVQYRLRSIDAQGRDLDMPFPHYATTLQQDTDEARRQLLRVGAYAWPCTTGNAFGREFLRRAMPLPEEFRRAPDGLLNRLAPLHGPVVTITDVLGDYRIHGQNVLAQQTLAPEKYAANVRYEIERERAVRELTRSFGYEIPEGILLRNKGHVETRLLSLRLSGGLHPVPTDRAAQLVWLGIRSTFWASDISSIGWIVWCLWFVWLGFLPRRTVAFLVRNLRLQSDRAPIAKLILSLSRLPAS